jgi:hypothetical protein
MAPRRLRRGLRRLRRRVRVLLTVRLAALALAVVASVLAALVWPLPDELIAASADRRLGLRDRLGTALELTGGGSRTGMEQAMVGDALGQVEVARPGEAFPFRMTRGMKVAAGLLSLLGAAQLLPIPAWLLSPREKEDRAFLRREAARIEPVAKKLEEEAQRAADVEAKELAKKMQLLAKEFKRGQLDRKQALVKLEEADRQLEKLSQKLAPPPPKTAAQAADEMSRAARRSLAAKAERLAAQAAQRGDKRAEEQLRKLAEQARKTRDPAALKKLAQELAKQQAKAGGARGLSADFLAQAAMALSSEDWDKLSELMESLEDLPSDLSAEELAQLEKDLKELAKALKNTDLDELSKCLGEACSSCKSGNCKASAAALKKAMAAYGKCIGRLKLAKACKACSGGYGMGVGPGDGKGVLKSGFPGASLYAPRETKTDGSYTKLPGQVSPNGPMLVMPGEEPGAPAQSSSSQVPYYEVIGEYSKAAEEALSKEEVPAGYRGTVREYFQSLQGENKK